MLLNTYDKIIALFNRKAGYMSFADLREEKITVIQMRELEERGVIQKISYGWYWCTACGIQKPADYKYIELGKVEPNAVICLESACYLHGLLGHEPYNVSIAIARNNRKQLKMQFPLTKHYYTNLENEYIEECRSVFGVYKLFNAEACICDCIKKRNKIESDVYLEIIENYRSRSDKQLDRLREYAVKMKVDNKISKVLESVQNEGAKYGRKNNRKVKVDV